jgi:hypothetical protein
MITNKTINKQMIQNVTQITFLPYDQPKGSTIGGEWLLGNIISGTASCAGRSR